MVRVRQHFSSNSVTHPTVFSSVTRLKLSKDVLDHTLRDMQKALRKEQADRERTENENQELRDHLVLINTCRPVVRLDHHILARVLASEENVLEGEKVFVSAVFAGCCCALLLLRADLLWLRTDPDLPSPSNNANRATSPSNQPTTPARRNESTTGSFDGSVSEKKNGQHSAERPTLRDLLQRTLLQPSEPMNNVLIEQTRSRWSCSRTTSSRRRTRRIWPSSWMSRSADTSPAYSQARSPSTGLQARGQESALWHRAQHLGAVHSRALAESAEPVWRAASERRTREQLVSAA